MKITLAGVPSDLLKSRYLVSLFFALLSMTFSGSLLAATVSRPDRPLPGRTVLPVLSGGGLDSGTTRSAASTEYLITSGQNSDDQNSARFAASTTVNGDISLIGAPEEAVNYQNRGAVFVYKKTSQGWQRVTRITAPSSATANAYFGDSMAFNGSIAAIGAPGVTVAGHAGQGAVYLYSYSSVSGTWTHSSTLVESNGNWGDGFGGRVAMSGGTLVVGEAVGRSVFVYSDSSGAWKKAATLAPSNGTANDGFGAAIAISGDTIVVGAPNAPIAGNNLLGGAVYVFSDASGTWMQTQEIPEPKAIARDGFGSSLAISGNNLIAGAPSADMGTTAAGAAYLFSNTGGNWSQIAKLQPDPSQQDENYGYSVALSGSNAIVGAPDFGENANGAGIGTGIAYIYNDDNGTWTALGAIYPAKTYPGSRFGWSVAAYKTGFLAGAPSAPDSAGSLVGEAYFTTQVNLGIAEDTPISINPGNKFDARSIVTNNGSANSPPLYIGVSLPPGIRYWSATTQQGKCNWAGLDFIFCSISPIGADGGTALIDVKISAPTAATVGSNLSTNAYILSAAPLVEANSVTVVKSGSSGAGGGGATGLPTLGILVFMMFLPWIKKPDGNDTGE